MSHKTQRLYDANLTSKGSTAKYILIGIRSTGDKGCWKRNKQIQQISKKLGISDEKRKYQKIKQYYFAALIGDRELIERDNKENTDNTDNEEDEEEEDEEEDDDDDDDEDSSMSDNASNKKKIKLYEKCEEIWMEFSANKKETKTIFWKYKFIQFIILSKPVPWTTNGTGQAIHAMNKEDIDNIIKDPNIPYSLCNKIQRFVSIACFESVCAAMAMGLKTAEIRSGNKPILNNSTPVT